MGESISKRNFFEKEQLLQLLRDVLGDERGHTHSKEQVRYDCPVCAMERGGSPDGKGNFEVNYRMGVFKCWVCEKTHRTHGSLKRLFRQYGTREQFRDFQSLELEFDYSAGGNRIYQTTYERMVIDLPDSAVPLTNPENKVKYSNAYNYLVRRGVTDTMIAYYHLHFVTAGKFKHRILFPSYDEYDELSYFTARAVYGFMKPKYLNIDINKEKIIFNEGLIDWNEPITLVEGVTDHIVISNSIPLLGKKLHELLHNRLYNNANDRIHIALDGDAYADAKRIYRQLDTGKLKGKIYIIKLPFDQDISEIYQNGGYEGLRPHFKQIIRLPD